MTEPVTTITNFLLTALAWALVWRLRQSGPEVEWSRRLWAWGMAVQGAGALLGGITHGFKGPLGEDLSGVVWSATLIALGAASGLLVLGLGVAVLNRRGARVLGIVVAAKFVGLCLWVSVRSDFLPALCDQSGGVLLLAGLLVVGWRRIGAAGWILAAGLGAAVVGAGLQQMRIGLSESFNHNDVYHVFGAVTLWCFYCAGRRFRDRWSLGEPVRT